MGKLTGLLAVVALQACTGSSTVIDQGSRSDAAARDQASRSDAAKADRSSPAADGPRSPLAGRYLLFSMKYRTTAVADRSTDEHVVLGHYQFSTDGSGLLHKEYHRGRANLEPTASSSFHGPMNAPYWNKTCKPGKLQLPTVSSAAAPQSIKWSLLAGALRVEVGTVTHEWKLLDAATEHYRLVRAPYVTQTGSAIVNGQEYSQGVGFGYAGNEVSRATPIQHADLLGSYAGEYFQNLQNVGATISDWWFGGSTLSASVFQATTDPDVRSYSCPCPTSAHPEMWCETSLLLNEGTNKLEVFVNGGHDFNTNGCMDETDHTIRLRFVGDAPKLERAVWLESSWETDGYPILSVGRYWKRSASDPTVRLDSPTSATTFKRGSTLKIAWTSANAPAGATIGRIDLWDGPKPVAKVAALPANLPPSGSKLWVIPASQPTGSLYRLQVVLYRGDSPIASAFSDGYFTIAP